MPMIATLDRSFYATAFRTLKNFRVIFIIAVLIQLAFTATLAAGTGELTLTRDGEALSTIVIADEPSRAAEEAARKLQFWIKKSSGAEIPICAESDFVENGAKTSILVGDTKRSRQLGISPDNFKLEEIRIKTFPGALVIIGSDKKPSGGQLRGTEWAANVFAEDCLGIRCLWPGDLGLVVPRQSTIQVKALEKSFTPVLRKRQIRNLGTVPGKSDRGLAQLGWKEQDYDKHNKESKPWFDFQNVGGSFDGNYTHSYGEYWSRFGKDHPEWFALQPDGSRDNSAGRAQLCVSNPGLIRQVAKDRIEELRQNPNLDCVSISFNDNGPCKECSCANCEAWDAADGPRIVHPSVGGEHVSLTDRYVRFYSEVARIVARDCPDRYLGAYAYSSYALPPVHQKVPPNVIIGYVGFAGDGRLAANSKRDEFWLGWSKSAKQMFLRPNALAYGKGLPTVWVHRMADALRFYQSNGMMFADFDNCNQHWSTVGLNYYVLAKLLWDINADVDAIIADYCRAGFYPADKAIRQYFQLLEDNTMASEQTAGGDLDEAAKPGETKKREFAYQITDEFLARANMLLDRADKEATSDETVRQRIAFLRTGLDHARIQRDWLLESHKPKDQRNAERIKQIEEQRQAFYDQLGYSWTINAPMMMAVGYRLK